MSKTWTYSRKYIGLSSEAKPVTTTSETIPAGSSFLETDTGKTAYWDGSQWSIAPIDMLVVDRLDTISTQLQAMLELHTAIAAKL